MANVASMNDEETVYKHVTVDQIVAANIRYWRRAAAMTQEELGHHVGWSAANISAAERSAEEGKERRRFDADAIADFAQALGVPLLAMFLPPADDGLGVRYYIGAPGAGSCGEAADMADLMLLVMPDSNDETQVMDAYRERLRAAVTQYLDPSWGADVARWLAASDSNAMRAERAAILRTRRDELLKTAAELDSVADAIEKLDGQP